MVAVATAVSVAIPGTHWVAFILSYIFDEEFLVKNMLFVKEKSSLVFIKPRLTDNDLVEQAPRILIRKCADAFFIHIYPGIVEAAGFNFFRIALCTNYFRSGFSRQYLSMRKKLPAKPRRRKEPPPAYVHSYIL